MSNLTQDEYKKQRGELEKRIARLKSELKTAGRAWANLANQLQTKPEQIAFSEGPGSLPESSQEDISITPIPWNDYLGKEEIAQKCQEMRIATTQLQTLQKQYIEGS